APRAPPARPRRSRAPARSAARQPESPAPAPDLGDLADLSPRFREALAELTEAVDPKRGVRSGRDLLEALRHFDWLYDEGEQAHGNAIAMHLAACSGRP